MRIFVIGAGQVGSTVVEALHHEHELTLIDLDADRLSTLSYKLDIGTIKGNGASRRTLRDAGIDKADLMIAATSRDEMNIVAVDVRQEALAETQDDRPDNERRVPRRSGRSGSSTWTSSSRPSSRRPTRSRA